MSLKSLSQIKEKRILKLWEGLGYYRRAKNLLSTTKQLAKNDFSLPNTLEEIKKLPGIGNYTANALLALVHDQQTLAVDGNVKRVFSRILNKKENKINFGQFIEINKKKFFNSKRNSDFVEALMEFGALVCKPKDPKCSTCHLNKYCKYFNSTKKITTNKNKMIESKNYDVFCYVNRKKQIALTKKNNLGFLNQFSLPEIRETKKNNPDVIWSFAHIAEYLNAGIKKIIEDRINKIFLSTFLNLIFNAIYKKNGIKDDTII